MPDRDNHIQRLDHYELPQPENGCVERDCVVIESQEKARLAKLEAIERQLYYLIGQVKSLKTT